MILVISFNCLVITYAQEILYLAYRQLTWYGWQYLGTHRHVVLPPVHAVAKIRKVFPSE